MNKAGVNEMRARGFDDEAVAAVSRGLEQAILIPEAPAEPCWTTRSGKKLPIRNLENQHLINLLRMLQRHAETKRRAIVELYFDLPSNWASLQGHFDEMHDLVMQQTWRDYTDDVFYDLEAEAARRKLKWDLFNGGPIFYEEEIDTTDRAGLRRHVLGALKDSITAHGPITRDTMASAAKRIIGQIHTYNRGLRKKLS
jgi:hypothetical protein